MNHIDLYVALVSSPRPSRSWHAYGLAMQSSGDQIRTNYTCLSLYHQNIYNVTFHNLHIFIITYFILQYSVLPLLSACRSLQRVQKLHIVPHWFPGRVHLTSGMTKRAWCTLPSTFRELRGCADEQPAIYSSCLHRAYPRGVQHS